MTSRSFSFTTKKENKEPYHFNQRMKRAAVFAHYDKHNKVDDYVVYYVKSLFEVCDCIVFVTTSDASESELSKLRQYCTKIIKRNNIGYDFMSYKIGLQTIDTGKYDEVVICNDSVYGPFFPLLTAFERMYDINCDFWGITESFDKIHHIQSYFVVFRKKVLESDCFRKFWDDIGAIHNKFEIINRYEIGLSQVLQKSGFKANSYILYRFGIWLTFKVIFLDAYKKGKIRFENIPKLLRLNKLRKSINPTHFFWKQLIGKHEMPFIKIELLRDNPMGLIIDDFESVIEKYSDYNTVYIKKHLERVKKESKKN